MTGSNKKIKATSKNAKNINGQIDELKLCKTEKEYEQIVSRSIVFNVKDVHYDLIINTAKNIFGWKCTRQKPHKETGSEVLTHAKADWDVMWIDADFYIDRVKGMKHY